ncbi:MAG: hypothetical protein JKY41_02990 [Rhodobacteraceae bacterium]|nr:hypothetical protein [Paracoccaceae bacterium]
MSILTRIKTDFSDLYLNIIPFGMTMISISYAGEAINIYTDNRWEAIFEFFQTFFAITVIVIGIPATIYNAILEIRRRRQNPRPTSAIEAGFMQTQYNTSAVRTFSFVFIALLVVDQFGPRLFPGMPPKFFLEAVISATLMFFSVSFWTDMIISNSEDSHE